MIARENRKVKVFTGGSEASRGRRKCKMVNAKVKSKKQKRGVREGGESRREEWATDEHRSGG
jgi:hypothetical protein